MILDKRNLLLAFIAILIVNATSAKSILQDDEAKRWGNAISSALGKDDIACLIDLPTNRKAFPLYEGIVPGRQIIRPFASLIGRDLSVIEKSVLLSRPVVALQPGNRTDGEKILSNLESLTPQLLDELADSGVAFNDLPSNLRMALSSIVSTNPGLSQQVLSGGHTNVRIYGSPVATFTDPETGRTRTVSIGDFPVDSVEERSKWSEGAEEVNEAEVSLPSDENKDVAIEFENGTVMSLRSLVNKCRQELQVDISFDTRLEESQVYVRGRFTRKEMVTALEKIMNAQNPAIYDTTGDDRKSRLDSLMQALSDLLSTSGYGNIGDISDSDLNNNLTMSASDLAAKNPAFAARMKRMNISPDTQIELGLHLGISMYSPGLAENPYGSATLDGKPVRLLTPNYVRYRISPP